MNTLIIDTSSKLQIVIVCSGEKIANKSFYAGITHTSTLLNNIDEACKSVGIDIDQLQNVVVGVGPGSFTGVRIGVTTARIIAQLLDIPIFDISTHELYAASFQDDQVLVAFDAKKKRVFGSLFLVKDYFCTPIVEPGDYKINDMLAEVEGAGKVVLIGDGISKYELEIKEYLSDYEYLSNFIPDSKNVCTYLESKLILNENIKKYYEIKPMYKRISDAEAAKNSKMNNYVEP